IKSSEKPAPAQVASQAAPPKLPKAVQKSEPQDTANSEKDSESDLQQAVLMQKEIQEPQNRPVIPSQQDVPKILEPAHPVGADLKQSTSGKHIRPSLGVTEQPNDAPDLKILPIAEKKHTATGANNPATTGAKAEAETHANVPSVGLTTSPFRRTKPSNQMVTMGPFEMVLKLLSLVLACFVILLLHRSNKIATNRYEALMYVQGLLEKRQSNS
ncbi:MAG: hypothetical protein PVG74_14495, partial [Desulfobacterales bacterium]